MNWLWFVVAAGLGGFVRYALEHKFQPVGQTGFPKATLQVNVAGSFLLGLVLSAPASVHNTIGIAFCGALTTFSGISAQLMRRVTTGAHLAAINYLVVTLVLGLGAAELGILLGKFFKT